MLEDEAQVLKLMLSVMEPPSGTDGAAIFEWVLSLCAEVAAHACNNKMSTKAVATEA